MAVPDRLGLGFDVGSLEHSLEEHHPVEIFMTFLYAGSFLLSLVQF